MVRPLLGKSEDELARWREALREALGPNGQLMVDLVPELKLIIGDQAPVPELPPQDAQRRFQLVFRRFLSVFARPEHPLALFLDDLQWLDAATLDLLEDLLTQPDVRHLLLIGAYRDNEVTSTHPLMRRLDAIRNAGALVQEIVLTPLTGEDVSRLIADSLYCDRERAASLAQLVLEKTDGNPFFVIQFLSALVEEGLLTFDHGAGRWSWDLTRIHAKGYTDNVVDLMVGKLSRLPIKTQEVPCSSSPAWATARSVRSWRWCARVRRRHWTAIWRKRSEPDSCSLQEMPIASFTIAFRKPRIPRSRKPCAPRPTSESGGCWRRTRLPTSGRRRSSRSSISSTAVLR